MPGIHTAAHGLGSVRFPLHVLAYRRSRRRDLITADIERWQEIKHLDLPVERALVHLLEHYRAFRSQFYFRVGPQGRALALIAPGMPTLS